ncbi:MurR/RpiR family transcriptional regulator [Halioxenophilus aromaticivorans]|uniref:MurR/RpiR family transcriptional regulator n=1 Tax=Halioxenophilus aromaticivorans TaxID=1306992 RepID=A0AAV3TVS7_9ALTE
MPKSDPATNKKNWSDIQDLIKSHYPSMSKRLQQVAVFVLENPRTVAFETIATISEQMSIPPSTLIRFASALGFDGFNEFKNLVKDDLLDQTSNYSNRVKLVGEDQNWQGAELLSRFAEANSNALNMLVETTLQDDLSAAVEMMHDSNSIFLLGNGRAHAVATYLHYALNHIDKKVFLIQGTGGKFYEEMSNVHRGDLLIAISYSPYSSNTCELAARAANQGVKVLSITDSPVSPLANTSALSFVVQEAKVDAFRSLSSSMLLAQVLAIALAARDSGESKN